MRANRLDGHAASSPASSAAARRPAAYEATLPDILRALMHMAKPLQDTFDLGGHLEGFLGRGDFQATALEQGKAQFLFKFLNLTGMVGRERPSICPADITAAKASS